MRKSFSNTALVAIAAGGMLFTSCGDHDLFNPNYKSEEYAANWEQKIGAIDPNQDWSMATKRTVTVSVSKTSEVKIYTKGLDKSYLLAANTVSGTMDIKFDARKGLAEVYVVATAGDNRDVRTVNITGETASADFTVSNKKAAKTRAGETALPERELVYALGYNLVKGQKSGMNGDYVNQINLGYNETYNYSNWGSNIYASGKWSEKKDQTAPETGTEVSMASLADVQTGCSELYTQTDNDITKLYPFTQDYKMVTAKAQEITMTGIFRNTAGNTALLYYYTAPKATANELKAADKYVLIPNTENIVGKEYKLIYYDPNNNYAPTYTFPANVEIHFALAINPSCMTKWVDWNNNDGDIIINAMKGDLMSFSDEVLNTDIFRDQKGWTSMASSAVYTYNDVNIISFEDWGGQFTVTNGTPSTSGDNSIDWNDIAFAINAEFQTPPLPVDKEQETGESWILACEDLGSTDDYDFNDIVLEVQKDIENNQIKIKCLAAGGTLPATIYYNDQVIGEAHAMLGESNTGKMINTTTITNTPIVYTVNESIDQNWTLSENKDKFKIVVNSDDNMAALINAPTKGDAPQMIIVPGDWKWPTERAHIEDAYSEFKLWNGNAAYTEWYEHFNTKAVINR